MILLVIDTQKGITNHQLYNFESFVDNIKTLINKARDHHIEVIYVRHDDGEGTLTKGNEDFEIYDEFKPLTYEKIFDKTVNSAFKNTGLLEYLQSINEKQVIVVGLQTEYCIDASIKCGFEHGFEMIVPEYSNTTFDNQFMSGEKSYQYYNNMIWKNRYAKCLSMEETLLLMENIKYDKKTGRKRY
ncbi:MAG: cysteine hydrolase [Coprobacillus cateniformis]|uniref:cysteine hydrolase family protein n=1 Tax=Longibaculum muris TaxID=1796628 RepID=UPI003AB16169|nr:cysteine hydrolase [Coprobacillus cateniformis]